MSELIRVVVVDDSPSACRLMISYLQTAPGVQVVGTALQGTRAVKVVKDVRPSVVTLDLEMPGMDGLVVLDQIIYECPTPVVVVSGVSQDAASSARHGGGRLHRPLSPSRQCQCRCSTSRDCRQSPGGVADPCHSVLTLAQDRCQGHPTSCTYHGHTTHSWHRCTDQRVAQAGTCRGHRRFYRWSNGTAPLAQRLTGAFSRGHPHCPAPAREFYRGVGGAITSASCPDCARGGRG